MILLPASFFGYSFSRNSADKGVIEKRREKEEEERKRGKDGRKEQFFIVFEWTTRAKLCGYLVRLVPTD